MLVLTQAQSANLANASFSIETAGQAAPGAAVFQDTGARDLYQRFFENPMQVNGDENEKGARLVMRP